MRMTCILKMSRNRIVMLKKAAVLMSFKGALKQRCTVWSGEHVHIVRSHFWFVRALKKVCVHGKQNCRLYSADNDMDPGNVPPELDGLSYIEEQLIAKIHPIISVYKIQGHQYGYKGNVVNFPQKVNELAKKLPHKISDINSIVTIRCGNESKHADFRVRTKKVRDALRFLKKNNPYYYDIEISEDNLQLLPEDGNVYDEVEGIDVTVNEDNKTEENIEDIDLSIQQENQAEDEMSDIDEDEANDEIVETFIPSLGQPSDEEKLNNILDWPTIQPTSINEFQTIGYVVQAFPCLFPYGKADLHTTRNQKVSAGNYFKHLMNFHDKRFAQHPRFRFFALNSLMRWTCLRNGSIFVKANEEFKDMDFNGLKEKLRQDPRFYKKIMIYNANIQGTKSYWYARGQELKSMIEQLTLPTLFFTLSSADFHWPDLYKVLAPNTDPNLISNGMRRKLIQENPAIVDSFFSTRVETYMTEV